LSFGAGSSAAPHQQQPITRAYNSHSSHPVKYKNQYISHGAQQQKQQKQQQQIVTTAMIATAPPTVNPDRRSSLISSSTTSSSAVTTIRQISGRTDWAAKYLQNTSTKYSK